jgi:hypothetical protein
MSDENFKIDQHSSDGIFKLYCREPDNTLYSVNIYGHQGETIWERTDLCFGGSKELLIDLRSVPEGVYVMIITGRRKAWVRKLFWN